MDITDEQVERAVLLFYQMLFSDAEGMSEESAREEWERDSAEHREALMRAMRTALAANPPATEPEGWKLVPVEPTDEMLRDANKASLSYAVLMDDARFSCERATYRAMLAAAPLPRAPQGERG